MTISLFEPYFNQYSEWRDNALEVIQSRLNEKQSVVYITMDIKNYYYSVDMKLNNRFQKLSDELNEFYKDSTINEMTEIINEVCTKYSQKVVKNKRCILPIGFIPSSVLSNWYLIDFDNKVLEAINPIYYGRYVDDIILVCNMYDTHKSKQDIINKYFVNTNVLRETKKHFVVSDENGGIDKRYKGIVINNDKLKVNILDCNFSSAEIEMFKRQIDKNRSEFKILPEDIEQCISDIYKINYRGSKNKLRNLDDMEVDKLELSKSISKIIFKGKQDIYINSSREYFNKELIYIFKYRNAIDNFRMWEKVIFYLNESNNKILVNNLIENLKSAIDKIQVRINTNKLNYKLVEDNETLCEKIKEFLKDNLIISIAMSGALKSEYNSNVLTRNNELKDLIEKYTNKIRVSNMMRHNYIAVPLINYCEDNDGKDFVTYNIESILDSILDERKLKYSPRFIHLHEFVLYYYLIGLKDDTIDYLTEAKNKFVKINYSNYAYFHKDKFFEKERIDFVANSIGKASNEYLITKIKIKNEELANHKVKIAIANIEIRDKDLEEIIKGQKSKVSFNKLKLFKKILNEAAKNDVDFIVLPEASVPMEWISYIAEFSRKHNIIIICGVQHFRLKDTKKIYNNIITVLPLRDNNYTSSLVKFRLKNHYAPFEKDLISKYGFEVPINNKKHYDLFTFNGVNFTCYNCFELASIEDRSIFKGYIDIMFASVLNKDTSYFSNIIESVTRDLHCYFVQVNTSQYGDNRITQPSSKDYKDIVKIKGGQNSYVVIGEVDINKLREFQILDYRGQMSMRNRVFKPTPPEFDVDLTRKKMNLETIESK